MKVLNKRTDNIPPGAVYVGRPSKWGNPYSMQRIRAVNPGMTLEDAHKEAVRCYREWLESLSAVSLATLDIKQLRGKDLVCWCAPMPCHADVLLELANEETE